MSQPGQGRTRFRVVHFLLFVPYIAILWVPSFNRADPAVAGIPFFYWYQMLWILLGALLLLPVYLADERDAKPKSQP